MEESPTERSLEITGLLQEWSGGSRDAAEEVMQRLYPELRRLAAFFVSRERDRHAIDITALVNETYVRLTRQTDVRWRSRKHFLGVAAQMMRRILVDRVRRERYSKRGGGARTLSLEEARFAAVGANAQVTALRDALRSLDRYHPENGRVVRLRFFAGLTGSEIAETLGVSPKTVQRRWRFARAYLKKELSQEFDVERRARNRTEDGFRD